MFKIGISTPPPPIVSEHIYASKDALLIHSHGIFFLLLFLLLLLLLLELGVAKGSLMLTTWHLTRLKPPGYRSLDFGELQRGTGKACPNISARQSSGNRCQAPHHRPARNRHDTVF